MARAALPGRPLSVPAREPAAPASVGGEWRTATITALEHPTRTTVLLRFDVPDRIPHLPGQHCVVRLRAEDGYTAQRSYSILSAPHEDGVELLMERYEDGEVSGFFADVARVGDAIEMRLPIGGFFVWDGATPAVALGGGTGAVPLVSMVRHARHLGVPHLVRVAVSARTAADVPCRAELEDTGALIVTTRERHGARGFGRLRADEVAGLAAGARVALVCGSTAFAGGATRLLLDAGVGRDAIRIEQFGPSGE
ncbi:oxidoreductase [Clavibacter michiganensis subsp. michiganensis]|nr:oxidoreductase [Clavibacter michiganensis subsp. michiganensis]MWJ09881.1 oxidoreductase [Clavibacter michiganensis subsp. michiganensis]MWJ15644.1 oxidoreductase [Clavibacter michiganensis subsp. michiganensis]MWJ21954.1 oxidoreductase [Clavibacter michiganensis subsp. michiganensis]MWJ43645.1 oxidoreductase [Clavibacter michiganensis subsp. michiganensis]